MTADIQTDQEPVIINATEVALKYANDVLSGSIVAGKTIQYAAKRFLEDLAIGKQRKIKYSPRAAQHVVNFFGCLKHSKGEWAGKPFVLEAWQVFVLANLFGWSRANGTRRFNEAYIEVARKNGKSSWLSGIGLYLLLADGEQGAEVYCAATKKDQAKICFMEAVRMRYASPDLTKHINAQGKLPNCNNLNVPASNSKFEPLSSEEDTLDGLNISGCIIDELHAHPNRYLYDVLHEATKARRNPMFVEITTAGYKSNDTSICWHQHEYGRKILEGVLCNAADNYVGDNFFVFIASMDEGDDWRDEKNWAKANPSLAAGIVKIDGLREDAAKAKEDPSALNSFLCKHLNVWTNQQITWMPPDKWAACNSAGRNADVKKLRNEAIEYLKGRMCYGGLDLSSKIDLTSFYLLFPPINEDKQWRLLGWNWVPKLNIDDRVKKDNVPYNVWVHEQMLDTTEGNVIDQDVIRAKLNEIKNQFTILELGYDSWNATQLALNLQKDGFKIAETRQGYKTFSEPMKELMGLVLSKKLEHYGDPVLTWTMSNVQAIKDPAGNLKPDKDKSSEKIDSSVAALMALACAIRNTGSLVESPYNKRGITFI